MISNRLVTRGFSNTSTNSLVTRGFIAGIVIPVVEVARRMVNGGRSAYKKIQERIENVIVYAKFKGINEQELESQIHGSTNIAFDKHKRIFADATKTGQATIKSYLDEILISVKRVRK